MINQIGDDYLELRCDCAYACSVTLVITAHHKVNEFDQIVAGLGWDVHFNILNPQASPTMCPKCKGEYHDHDDVRVSRYRIPRMK